MAKSLLLFLMFIGICVSQNTTVYAAFPVETCTQNTISATQQAEVTLSDKLVDTDRSGRRGGIFYGLSLPVLLGCFALLTVATSISPYSVVVAALLFSGLYFFKRFRTLATAGMALTVILFIISTINSMAIFS